MDNKTLIFLTDGFPYGKGETFVENEIKFLSERFSEIVIITFSKKDQLRLIPKKIKVLSYEKGKPHFNLLFFFQFDFIKEFFSNLISNPFKNKIAIKSWLQAQRIKTFILKQGFPKNSIFYSYWLDDKAIALSLLKEKHPNMVYISRAHGWDVYQDRHQYSYLPFREFLGKKLDKILAISSNGLKELEKQGIKNTLISRLGVIQNEKISFEVEGKTFKIVSIASIIPLKRILLLAEAFLLINNTDIEWHHFGDGNQKKELLKIMENDTRFHFHGHLDNSAIKTWLLENNHNTLLVNTSTTEGIPVSMMEAMSFGTPCIGTNVGGVSEIIEDGVNGFLLSPNPTLQEIVEVIVKYQVLPIKEKKIFRQNAYNTWQEKYNAKTNYTKFIQSILNL
ncbi:MAG: glycosyltransferase [Chitinophagales bacterium]|nr:glycosyltransferase [Bacteroidota bacterium]MCB9225864.1 glycosyltransferase [Chitinophagales bacterium]